MTPAQVELARAAVALPGWRWEAGCAWRVPRDALLDDIMGRVEFPPPRREWEPYPGAIPDLDDRATGGVLLAMRGPGATLEHGEDGWLVVESSGWHGRGATLAEACCALAVARGGWG